MSELRAPVLDALDRLGIPYRLVEHPPVFTMAEMAQAFDAAFPDGEAKTIHIAKNLFLRDAKGRRHFLVLVDGDKPVDLARLSQQLDATKLSFASEGRLMEHLGLQKGSVTPFGLLNDPQGQVEVVVDTALEGHPQLGFHPNENTATLLLSYQGLCAFLADRPNPVTHLTL